MIQRRRPSIGRQRGFLLNPFRFGAPSGGDPHFASVKLLLHCDGADGSTTFTDHSPVGRTVTAAGNAQLDTAQFKFGTASALFDGADDRLILGASSDWLFGSADFTIEAQVRRNTLSVNADFISCRSSTNSTDFWFVRLNTNGTVRAYCAAGGSAVTDITSVTSVPVGAWRHVAVVRESGSVRIYIDGVNNDTVATNLSSAWHSAASVPLYIGVSTDALNNDYSGHLDEIRITKGVARYTATFTPPAAAFPNY